ncbi:hypothetical protein D3C85_1193670 [compost metagenome]
MEALVQHPDDHARNDRTEDPGVDGLNAQHALNVVGFQDGSVSGWQNAFGGQPEVHCQVHHRVTDETRKCGHAFVFARQTQRDCDTEHHRQEAKREGADFAHPDEDRLQHRIAQEWDQGNDIVAAERAADPEHDPAKRE